MKTSEKFMGKVLDRKLKDCPFCGGRAVIMGFTIKYLRCTTCHSSTKLCSTEEEAANLWNRRIKQ